MISTQPLSQQTEKIPTPAERCFDYTTLDAESRSIVQQQTSEIRTLMRRTAQDIINIGQKLISVKEQLGHGQFRNWLKAEFDWSVRTAARFMQVATKFKSANLAHLNIAASAVYLLAEPSTPDEAYEEALELAKRENITYAKAKDIINQHKEAAKLIASKPGNAIAPTMTVEPTETVEAESAAVVKQSEDKLLPGKRTEALVHSQVSNLSHDIAPDTDSCDCLLKKQTEIDIQSLALVGNFIYLTDFEQQESKLLGQVAEVKEKTANDVVIRISLQSSK